MDNLKQSGLTAPVLPTQQIRKVKDQQDAQREEPRQPKKRPKPRHDDEHQIDEYA